MSSQAGSGNLDARASSGPSGDGPSGSGFTGPSADNLHIPPPFSPLQKPHYLKNFKDLANFKGRYNQLIGVPP